MKEIHLIRSLFGPQTKRSLDLIVSSVDSNGPSSKFDNEHWYYSVPFAFRDALDIRLSQRIKAGKPTQTWSQGPYISFSEGDVLTSKDGSTCLQVIQASPVSWDATKGSANEGLVTYKKFAVADSRYEEIAVTTCSQIEFLTLLMLG